VDFGDQAGGGGGEDVVDEVRADGKGRAAGDVVAVRRG